MTRRSHTKSRHGCLSCKQRRVKCDERKPKCQKCITRDAVCTYQPSTPLVWVGGKVASSDDGEARSNNSKLSPPARSLGPQNEHISITNNPALNLENVNLIIHWFTTTVHTVNSVSNSAAIEVCQTVILNQAMQHNFLLHGLLALSALHLGDSHSDPQKYTRVAIAHHTEGLALYHAILSNINKENYAASVAFSSITIIFEFGRSRPQAPRLVRMELVDDLARIFLLAKGWHRVVGAANELECSEGPTIFRSPNLNAHPLSTDTETAFGLLLALSQGHDNTLYAPAISSLKSVFRTLADEGDDNPHIALEWANKFPEGFVRLIRERQNLALVIVGYYCVVLDRVPQVWWLKGWSKGLFSVIWETVDHTYQETLEWPREKMGIEA